MPMTRPELPTYRSHPNVEACSTATRAFSIRIAGVTWPWCPNALPLEELPQSSRSSPCFLPLSPHLLRVAAPFVWHLVPETNHRIGTIVLVSQGTEAGRAQQEIPAGARLEPKPARCEHSEEMSTRKGEHVTLDGPHPAYHAVGPRLRPGLGTRLPGRRDFSQGAEARELALQTARCRGLVSTAASLNPSSHSPRRTASASP